MTQEKKQFIIGVGCQKGGTTWLYNQLVKSSEVDLGFIKEYHVFDALYVKEMQGFRHNYLQLLANATLSGNPSSDLLKILSFYADTKNYFDYFDYLWYKGGNRITSVGDITPSYSALPVNGFKKIKEQLESYGFDVKVIFLMRDPVERIWSSIRMEKRRQPSTNMSCTASDEQVVLRQYKDVQQNLRTRYDKTITNLEEVFDPDQIFYSVYERLFQQETVQKLVQFLDLSDHRFDVDQRLNISPKLFELSEMTTSEVANYYRPVYEFCDRRFGIQDVWQNSKFLL